MTITMMPGEPAPDADLTPLALVTCRLGGCRHRACRLAASAHRRTVPPVPSAGTRRRLRALARMAWSPGAMAGRLSLDVPRDVAERALRRVQAAAPYEVPEVPPWFAATAAALYDDLWDVGGGSADAAAYAIVRGWAPPLAWDDNPGDPHFIDDPGAPVSDWRPRRADLADRAEDIRDLMTAAAGYRTSREVGWRLGISPDSVERLLSRARRAS